MVSALKVDGKRLHELAREGIEVERQPRPVTVHRFTVAPTDDPLVVRAEVECSSGTYVRTLAADLGHALGGGAHLRDLRRTAIGSFTLAEARPLAAISPEVRALPGGGAARLRAGRGHRRRRRSTSATARCSSGVTASPATGPGRWSTPPVACSPCTGPTGARR